MIRSPTRWAWPLAVALIIGAILPLSGAAGCGTSNPVSTAATATPANQAETVAFALHNSYVVIAEQAATIAEDSTTPVSVKKALVTAHEAASPWAKKLYSTALAYEQVRKAVAAGTTAPEKALAALTALNQVITEAAPKINALAVAVKGGTP